MMARFISWMTIGIAAAFLVYATAAFSLSTIATLTFAIGVGVLVVSIGVCYEYREHVGTLATALATAAVSAWTIVASLVFSQPTIQNLALASGLALAGLAIVGLGEHELATERAVERSVSRQEYESRFSPAG